MLAQSFIHQSLVVSSPICQLEAEEYQMRRFVAGEKLVSGLFPQLDLTADAVFAAVG